MADKDPIRVGILYSETGVTSTIGLSQLQGALLGIEEINAAGGVDGREIMAVRYDPQSNPARYAMSTLPKVPNDPGINSGSRYGSGAVGVNNAYYYCDDEYYLPPTNPQKFRGNVEGTVGGMGPTGPTGPAGPAGPQGPLGPDGDGNLVLEKYTGAQLGDKTSAANTVGKTYGKMVLDTSTGKVVRANASGATGTWKNVGTGATEYSPS